MSFMESESEFDETIDLDDDDNDSNFSSSDLQIQPFKVITSDDVVTKMKAEIKDVSDVLQVRFEPKKLDNLNRTKAKLYVSLNP